MATTAGRTAPAHLWIVGLLALLWNAYGAYEYVMTQTHNAAFLASLPAGWLEYWQSLPPWLSSAWALGVWGGLVGAALLLIRSRHAVWAFAFSFVGVVVDLGYQMVMTEMPQGMLTPLDGLIIAVAAFLLLYARYMEKEGVLR